MTHYIAVWFETFYLEAILNLTRLAITPVGQNVSQYACTGPRPNLLCPRSRRASPATTQPQRARALLRRFNCDVIAAAPKKRGNGASRPARVRGNWKDAREHLRAALRSQPRLSGRRVRDPSRGPLTATSQGTGCKHLPSPRHQPRDYTTPQLLLSRT